MKTDFNTPSSVLFVDDEEKARKYFALAMTSNFDVLTAGSATEAMGILEEHAGKIAIIVSDQRMPEKTGVELLKAVKDYYPHIVRLLTTAYTDLDDAIEAINRGEILRYIQKPWDINVLKTELKQAMNYFQLRNERDNLLEEKLSVRQRMVQIERITHLLLAAEAIPCLRFSTAAVRLYIDQLISNKAAFSLQLADSESQRLDFWDLTLAETGRMQKFIREVKAALNPCLPLAGQFNTSLNNAAIKTLLQQAAAGHAGSLQAEITDSGTNPVFSIKVDEALFILLLKQLTAFVASQISSNSSDSESKTLAIGISATSPADTLQLEFEFALAGPLSFHEILSGSSSKEIAPGYCALLLCYLVSAHHGGCLEVSSDAACCTMTLSLPQDPNLASPVAEKANWHEKTLQCFEPDI